ncbi:MAG TPA: LPS export ABC transporter permease LptF [Rhodospirillaceae bacterium]|nr:LPS export ABC transporter permease LptF [Rhodospirillaceae bacterium]HIJ91851.1 LPS export ABC transporter permease LptF [Rhodospirillaceae bacterium]
MNGFNKYVLKQLLVGMILVTIGLTCVIWLTQSLRYVEMIVNRGLTAGTFIYFIILLLPKFLSIILPIAIFAVVVFIYSKLITDRELVIMRGAGQSQTALAKPALILAMMVVMFGYLLNLYLLPESYRMFRALQWDIRYSFSHILLQEGTFNTVSKGITVYVRERTKDGQLLGILVHDQRSEKNPFTILAERGALVESKDGSRVVMFNGNRQSVDPKTHQMSILYFDRNIYELDPPKTVGDIRYRGARERTLKELFNLKKADVNLNDYGKFIVEMHKRMISPLSALGFTFVGLACLITGSFRRRNQSRRSVLAVAIIVCLQASVLGLENACAKNLDLIPLMYANAILPIFGGYLLMLRTPRRRRTVPALAMGIFSQNS